MSNQEIVESEHEKVLSMLPWYVNQTLDLSDVGLVTDHIDKCQQCRDEMQFLKSLHETVQGKAEEEYVAKGNVERDFVSVMGRIDAQERRADTHVVIPPTLLQKIRQFFDFDLSLSTAQWGGAAMAGVLVAVLGVQVFNRQSSDDYTVLSSAAEGDSVIQLSVQLAPEQKWDKVVSVIQSTYASRGWQVQFLSDDQGNPLMAVGDTIGVSELNKMIIELEGMQSIERVELRP